MVYHGLLYGNTCLLVFYYNLLVLALVLVLLLIVVLALRLLRRPYFAHVFENGPYRGVPKGALEVQNRSRIGPKLVPKSVRVGVPNRWGPSWNPLGGHTLHTCLRTEPTPACRMGLRPRAPVRPELTFSNCFEHIPIKQEDIVLTMLCLNNAVLRILS